MKVLLGYDGSDGADIALKDLLFAGLPRDVQIRIVSMADIWPELTAAYSGADEIYAQTMASARDLASGVMAEARSQAEAAAAHWLSLHLPHANVSVAVAAGSPGHGLVRQSQDWGSDLVVVGPHGRSVLGRLLLGSVSHHLLSYARCSVRIARVCESRIGEPLRIIVGVDGSSGAGAAVDCVARRGWPQGSSARVVVAIEHPLSLFMPPAAGVGQQWVAEHGTDSQARAKHAARAAADHLTHARLSAVPIVRDGSPKKILLDEADEWGADCIFVGAQGLRGIDRLLMGSVSMAVSMRAGCSVEVVRRAPEDSSVSVISRETQ